MTISRIIKLFGAPKRSPPVENPGIVAGATVSMTSYNYKGPPGWFVKALRWAWAKDREDAMKRDAAAKRNKAGFPGM